MNQLSKRRQTRQVLMTMLYQIGYTSDLSVIKQQALEDHGEVMDLDYFNSVVDPLFSTLNDIDAFYLPFLPESLPINQITQIERAIIRLAIFEMFFQTEVPKPVAINEAIELAKTFGTEKGYQFVNAVLDAAKKMR